MTDEEKKAKKELEKLQKAATKLGVAFTDKTSAEELAALIEEAKAKKDEEKKAKKPSFDVYNTGGALVRTYTVEDQGEDAESLAQEYANKIGGTVV